jgi:hypothetical protein
MESDRGKCTIKKLQDGNAIVGQFLYFWSFLAVFDGYGFLRKRGIVGDVVAKSSK